MVVARRLVRCRDATRCHDIFGQRALPWQSIVLAHFLTAFLDVLRFFLIQAGEFVARVAHYVEHSRNGHDWSDRFPLIAEAAATLRAAAAERGKSAVAKLYLSFSLRIKRARLRRFCSTFPSPSAIKETEFWTVASAEMISLSRSIVLASDCWITSLSSRVIANPFHLGESLDDRPRPFRRGRFR